MGKFVMIDAHTLPESDFAVEKEMMEANGFEFVRGECKTIEDIVAIAKDAEVLGDVYFKIGDELLSQLPNCKGIVRYGIGYDVVDVDAASKRNVALCNLPSYCVHDVATHALALMMGMIRKLPLYDRTLRSGDWNTNIGYDMHRLDSLTLGLVGFGNTARIFASYVKGLGMKVITSDPYMPKEITDAAGVENISLDDLFATADIISLHIPAIPETQDLICKESICKMKDGVMIINTARGSIVHLDDLLDALDSGKVSAAGLDVMNGEPISDQNARIFSADNIIVTPHIAYSSAESSDEQHLDAAKTALALLKGEHPSNIVNRKQLSF